MSQIKDKEERKILILHGKIVVENFRKNFKELNKKFISVTDKLYNYDILEKNISNLKNKLDKLLYCSERYFYYYNFRRDIKQPYKTSEFDYLQDKYVYSFDFIMTTFYEYFEAIYTFIKDNKKIKLNKINNDKICIKCKEKFNESEKWFMLYKTIKELRKQYKDDANIKNIIQYAKEINQLWIIQNRWDIAHNIDFFTNEENLFYFNRNINELKENRRMCKKNIEEWLNKSLDILEEFLLFIDKNI